MTAFPAQALRVLGAGFLCLFAAWPVSALQPGAASLPGLIPAVQPVAPRAEPTFSWQLHQQFGFQPATGNGTLQLQPSISVTLHDPQARTREAMAGLAAELMALDDTQAQVAGALAVHRDYLLFQQLQFLSALYNQWLGQWHDLPAARGQADWEAELERLQVTQLAAAAGGDLQLLALRLQSAGALPPDREGPYLRPRTVQSSVDLPTCLSGSSEIRRLELLADHQGLDGLLYEQGREFRVEATAGASVGLNAPSQSAPAVQFGWNVGMIFARADYGGPRMQLAYGGGSISQSLTLRGPEPDPDHESPKADWLSAAADSEALRLLSLLNSAAQSAGREAVQRQLAEATLLALDASRADGSALRSQLFPALESVSGLAQASLQHDFMVLELAAACRLPLQYVEVAVYP